MPQASDELRAQMERRFGNPVNDADPDELEAAITAWNTRLREAELEAEVGRLREGVRRALTYMDPMSPGHSSHKMADARRVLQTAISHPKGADE